jgi:hypothetical protein
LIILAHDNAVAGGKEPSWIGELYREALGASNKATRKDAEAMLPELGGIKSAAVGPAAKAKPAEIVVMPAGGAADAAAPAASTASSDAAPLGSAALPPASIGLSVGFGASSTEGGIKP